MQEKLSSSQQKLNDINYNYRKIEENIANAALISGRTRDDITFLAATKTVDVEYINYAVSLGLRYIGENKVQELLSKYEGYALDKCSLQFIGHLQSNRSAKGLRIRSEQHSFPSDILSYHQSFVESCHLRVQSKVAGATQF